MTETDGWSTANCPPPPSSATTAGLILREIRSDGTVFQIADYCLGEDWTHESRWEPQSDGSIRILPKAGENGVPFQHAGPADYDYIEIRPSNGSSPARLTIRRQ